MAWTWGRLVSSNFDNLIGLLAKTFNSSMTSSNAGVCALEDNIPVISAGIPADRRVVEACSEMHFNAPYELLVCIKIVNVRDIIPDTTSQEGSGASCHLSSSTE
jgi:hypothetical protein